MAVFSSSVFELETSSKDSSFSTIESARAPSTSFVPAGDEEIIALPYTRSSCPERFVIFTILFEFFSMPSAAAASGDNMIATPSDGSSAPITRISTFALPATFETFITSPGRYPTVFANNPCGKTPFSTTTALPSREGLKDVNMRHIVVTTKTVITLLNLFFIPYPSLGFIFLDRFIYMLNKFR